MVQIGDKIPSVDLNEGSPAGKVNTTELCAGKKVVLFAVPGAFTPGCSKTHLPGYVADFDKYKAAGIDVVACVSVNDAFVMAEWGKAHGADDKIRMLADPRAEFAKAMGVEMDATPMLGNVRSKRYSVIVVDGVIREFNLEPDGAGLTCSLSPNLLTQIAKL